MTLTTHTLTAPGATLTYDVRGGSDNGTKPPLMLIGSPMAASGFAALAGHFDDRTVITYDPRGAERSTKDDSSTESTPEQHADDVHRVIEAADLGPVDLFASSGGAVNALALMARHPGDVRRLVAHEPPLTCVLPDRSAAEAAVKAVAATYQASGFGAGMAHFISMTSQRGPLFEEFAAQPPPAPQAFGMPSEDDGKRDDVLLAQNITSCTWYEPDWAALKSAGGRITLAAGTESEGELANRAAHAVADRLGAELVVFPSHHGGFVGGDHGWAGQPEAFAAKLHEVLDEGAMS